MRVLQVVSIYSRLNEKFGGFEINTFVCISCNSIECIGDLDIELKEYEINNVVINGRCKNCSIKPNF
jgi:hypothetical protein